MEKRTRTTTKKKVKRRLRWQGVFFLAFVGAGLYLGVQFLIHIDVNAIKVTGNEYVRDAQIIKSASLNENVSYLGFSARSACASILEDPLIKTCKIKRKFNFDIEIIVEENVPLFFYTNENAIVLSDGSFITGANLYGLPTLVNYVPEEVLSKFISRLSAVDGDIIRSISEIEYSPTTSENGTYIDKERFIFDMNDGNTVIINNRNMDVFNRYKTIYASIDKKGVYNLDCDYDSYIFTEYGDGE